MKKLLSYLFALAAVAFAFTSCEDVPMPYDYPNSGNNSENVDPNAKGQSADNPYTVQEAVQLIKDGKAPTTEVYVKGIVSKLDYYNSEYKSLSYYISDDGKTEDMQVYSGKGLNGADFNSKSDLKVGQTVVVKGVIKSFDKKGTTIYEVDKNSQIVSIEGEGSSDQPSDEKGQSKENPYSVKEAVDLINSGKAGNTEVYVKGIVSSVDYFNSKYKSLSYYLSDDGKSKDLDVYSGKGLNGADFKSKSDLKVGQTVIVKGKLELFTDKSGNKIPEVSQSSEIVSIEGSGSTETFAGYSFDFTKGQGEWTIENKNLPSELKYIWNVDTRYGMKGSAFANKVSYASESWLISPAISLVGTTSATLTINHAANYFASSVDKECSVLVSTDKANWTPLSLSKWPANDYKYVNGTADLSSYAGKTIYLAFKYTSTAKKAGTWEVKTINIK